MGQHDLRVVKHSDEVGSLKNYTKCKLHQMQITPNATPKPRQLEDNAVQYAAPKKV